MREKPLHRQAVIETIKKQKYKATGKSEFKIPLRKAGPPNHLDDTVDSDQCVVNR